MKITSTVTTPVAASTSSRRGRRARSVEGGSTTTGMGLPAAPLGSAFSISPTTSVRVRWTFSTEPPLLRPAQIRHALPDVGAVLGELVGERHELTKEHPSDAAREAKGEENDDEDGRRAPGPPSVYRVDHRAQQECEQPGERDRDQNALTPVETRHDERTRREGDEGANLRRQ